MANNPNPSPANASDQNLPEPIQPESLEVDSSLGATRSSSGQPSKTQSSSSYSGESHPPITQPRTSQNADFLSPTPSNKPPSSASASQPNKKPPASVTNSSPVRRTSPYRTTTTAGVEKIGKKNGASKGGAEKGPSSNHKSAKNSAPKAKTRNVQVRIPLFFMAGIGLSLLAGGLKAIAAALAEGYLYSLPWMGGFLRSIELSEISNLVAFALLASGIGAATIWLPRRWNPWAKAGLLIAVSPFVFSASYLMHQRLWVQRVAQRSAISYPAAQQITNDFLQRETGKRGFFGFYPYSTEVADLPTSRATLEGPPVGNASQLLTKELASYDDPRADLVAYLFERVGWLLRFMYMAIATLTALIYYFKGREWADDQQMTAYKNINNGPGQLGQKRRG